MSRIRVAIVFGGKSVEREVSRISARTIASALDPARYEVIPIAVTEAGRFLPPSESGLLLSSGAVPERFRTADTAGTALVPSEIAPGRVDVAFPIIHGTTGEDGALQGFLETLGVPYVGAGVTASAVGMDKAVFKALLRDAGIPTPRSVVVSHPGDAPLADALPLPLFVKPSTGGSSVGVTKVKIRADLPGSVAIALRYGERALIEEGIDGREIECSVLGDEDPRASLPGEVVPGHEFYDYDDKYRDDTARLIVPAELPSAAAETVQSLAITVFRLCGVSGMARVDFFLERGSGRVLVNEINTLPGFTAISMYPKLWEASGLPLPRLLDELVRLALARQERRARLWTKPPAELS